MSRSPRKPVRRSVGLASALLAALFVLGAAACQPSSAPQNWRYNTVRQAHSTATFGAHHEVRYRYNGRRIEVLKSSCAADNWYSGLRYTGRCTAVPRNGRLEVTWEWIWAKGSPPIARSQTYVCDFNVSKGGKITRLKPRFLTLPCNKFVP